MGISAGTGRAALPRPRRAGPAGRNPGKGSLLGPPKLVPSSQLMSWKLPNESPSSFNGPEQPQRESGWDRRGDEQGREEECCPPHCLAALGSVYRITASVDSSVRERRGLSHIPVSLAVKASLLMGCEGVSPAPSQPLPPASPVTASLPPPSSPGTPRNDPCVPACLLLQWPLFFLVGLWGRHALLTARPLHMLFRCFFVSTSLLGLLLPPERLQPSSALCYERQFSPPSPARDWEPLRSNWFPRMQDGA